MDPQIFYFQKMRFFAHYVTCTFFKPCQLWEILGEKKSKKFLYHERGEIKDQIDVVTLNCVQQV